VARRREEVPVDVTVPITPMLDMSFQLLSFFVVTFQQPSQEGQLLVDLPKLDASQKSEQQSNPDDVIPDEYTVTVIGDFEIRSLTLKGGAFPETSLTSSAHLFEQLSKFAETKPKDKRGQSITVTIEADQALVYSKLIELMDSCKRAGIEQINLTPYKPK
jgi:biopolymer transport protein ExbD